MTGSPSATVDRLQILKDAAPSTRRLFPSLPYLALVFGLAAIGSSAIFVKWANAPGPVTGFYRMSIASVLIALPFAVQVRRQNSLSMRHLGFALLAGFFFAAFFLAAFLGAFFFAGGAPFFRSHEDPLGLCSPVRVCLEVASFRQSIFVSF